MSDELIEAMARAIYESQFVDEWSGGDGIEAEQFRQCARAVIPIIRAHLEPTSEMVEAARKQGQDEGFAAAVQWLRDRSAQKPAAYLALEADVLANGLENSRIPYAASPIGEIG